MVLGYHVVFCAYGFWLPNDPRGSNSWEVRAEHLRPFGEATLVADRQSHARDQHDRGLRASAKRALWQPALRFSGQQAQAIGAGFAKYVRKSEADVYACAILPEHVHMVIGRHSYRVEQIVNLLKGAATRELIERGLHPGQIDGVMVHDSYRVWGRNLRKVFLNSIEEIANRIEYVERNPVKEGKRKQEWSFVREFEGR